MKTWLFHEPVTAVLLTTQMNILAVCLGGGVILWQPSSDTRVPHGFRLPDWPKVRLNDAAIDPRGSLFVGSMRNNVNEDGSAGDVGGQDGVLFRIDPDKSITECEHDIGISNTLAWSPDHKHFYFGDSLQNTIWRYHYDSGTGTISKSGVHFADYQSGVPDGSTMDQDGYLWNCRYGGSCIVRIDPDGEIDQVIELPTKNITNCTFGGEDLNILYITTAASSDESDRLAGGLFQIRTDVRGLPENRLLLGKATSA